MRVMVFGAQSHIGLALCEMFIEDGIEVCAILLDCPTKRAKLLLEERMMLIGRNALFQYFYLEDEWNNESATHVMYCKEDGHNQDQLCFKRSVTKALGTNSYYFYVSPATIQREGDFRHLQSTLPFYSIIELPKLYGPFQPPEEQIHQHLYSFLTGQKESLIIHEPLVFINDAAETIVEIMRENEYENVYSFLSELRDEKIESFSVELKMNATEKAQVESNKRSLVKKTSFEEGLLKQLTFIKAYRGIYEIDS